MRLLKVLLAYRRYKIQELSEEEYNIARSEFLDWLEDVKSQTGNFVQEQYAP